MPVLLLRFRDDHSSLTSLCWRSKHCCVFLQVSPWTGAEKYLIGQLILGETETFWDGVVVVVHEG